MLKYLMDSRNAKPIVTNLVFPWIFDTFVSFHSFLYILVAKKHALFNKFLSR